MSAFPATTVRVTAIEQASDSKVRIKLELLVDVHRLAEVGSDLLQASIPQVSAARKKKNN
jgi:hypothetical protein